LGGSTSPKFSKGPILEKKSIEFTQKKKVEEKKKGPYFRVQESSQTYPRKRKGIEKTPAAQDGNLPRTPKRKVAQIKGEGRGG